MFVEHSVILCDQLQIIMKICGPGREYKGSLVQNITQTGNSWLMLIRIVKFRKTQGAAQGVWSTGNVYSALVGKCFEMAIWKTGDWSIL